MPRTKTYRALHERVLAGPGAAERIAAHRQEALAEIGLYQLRQMAGVSQPDARTHTAEGEANTR